MGKSVVKVRDVKKQFSYSNHNNNSLKRAITQAFKPKDKSKDTFFALDGISFDVEQGDFFGILGRNGSGKSTLLKIISEIYQPTSGTVEHHGKLVSFIELGVGFKAELTGRENVYLNGGLLGFSKAEVDAMYDEIVEFAELENFMEQKLKNYSSGMKVRLAFSLAIRSHADILILDEVLAVGDTSFKRKSTKYFDKLKEDKSKTVILVTHSMSQVEKYCNKAIVIEEGKISYEGDAYGAAEEYMNLFEERKRTNSGVRGVGDIDLSDLSISRTENNVKVIFNMKNTSGKRIENVRLDYTVLNKQRKRVTGSGNMIIDPSVPISLDNEESVRIEFEFDNIFTRGDYVVNLKACSSDQSVVYASAIEMLHFSNRHGKESGIAMVVPTTLRVTKNR